MFEIDEHAHQWGPVRQSHLSGEVSRPCTVSGCRHITLDLYLYCTVCGGPVSDPDSDGKYHHLDPETRQLDLSFDAGHTPDVESGEAPYDEETEG